MGNLIYVKEWLGELTDIGYPLEHFILLIPIAIVSFLGSLIYYHIALQHGIIAQINFRSLHARVVPRGGGVVVAALFSSIVIALWALGALPSQIMAAFGIGGAAAGTIGFIDDVYDIRARWKILLQLALGLTSFAICYQPIYARILESLSMPLSFGLSLALVFGSVWFINVYNFIDGIDGMAITGAAHISVSAIVLVLVNGGDPVVILVFALLAASGSGFLLVNLPPARVFMGDSGSMFFGYCLGTLLLITTWSGQITVWAWLCILSYFVGDTTTTGLYRLLFVKRWYGAHRSHAYQNLARITESHALITYGVNLYNLLWALPMAIWATLNPERGPIAAMFSLTPTVAWTLRFGPSLSSK